MNIFVSDARPATAAINLDDKRLIKMILETAQILSTAVILNGGEAPYRPTHVKHPATLWAARTRSNFDWLLLHGISLGMEYYYRFNKYHKSFDIILNIADGNLQKHIPTGRLEPFANCTTNKEKGISFKHIADPVEAYKAYLSARWNTDTRPPKWTNRTKPEWYVG